MEMDQLRSSTMLRSPSVLCAIAIAVSLLSQPTAARETQSAASTQDLKEIVGVLRAIPYWDQTMPSGNLADRLPDLGLTVALMCVQRVSAGETMGAKDDFKVGDVAYDFYTNEPNEVVKKVCPIWSQFQFIKRGKSWIPTSRTSQFLLTSRCEIPK
jgi:hypothetical protein